MIKQCLQCGKDYESKRATSKYCGDSCKKSYQRRTLAGQIVPVTSPDVPVNEVSGTSLGDLGEFSVPHVAKIVDSGECSRQNTFLMVGVNKDINYGAWKPIGDLGVREVNRVPVPGDVDYVGCCGDVDGVWEVVG